MSKQFNLIDIEKRIYMPIVEFLYQMHWEKDMMHKEIGDILGISRPTITRWFKKYNILSKPCHRFTNRNLTSWPYIIGLKKKKEKGPDKRIQRTKGNINVDFFKSWSEEMAYVLGYFDGDGCVSYGFYKKKGRNNKTLKVSSRFISSSKEFLWDISKKLNIYATMRFGCISKQTYRSL